MNLRITRRDLIKKTIKLAVAGIFYSCMARLLPWSKMSVFAQNNKDFMSKVIRIYNKKAVTWDYKTPVYLDYISQKEVNRMIDAGVCALTGRKEPASAWRQLFPGFSSTDKIAIKPNFNFVHHGYKDLYTSPQVISGIVRGLVENLGAKEQNIFIYELCRPIPKENIRDRIPYNVNYIDLFDPKTVLEKIELRMGTRLQCADRSAPVKMSNEIFDERGERITCYMPKVLTHAQHLINVPIMTNHIFISASGPLKNHFGTVRFSNNSYGPQPLHGSNIEQSIVDLNANEHIKNKTRLIVGDGLLGVYARGDLPGIRRWKTFPCDNGIPNSLFFSKDPVAIESVVNDHLLLERRSKDLMILSRKYIDFAKKRKLGVKETKKDDGNYKKLKYVQLSVT